MRADDNENNGWKILVNSVKHRSVKIEINSNWTANEAAPPGFRFGGGNILGGRPGGGLGGEAEPPVRRRIFENCQKISYENC